MKNEKEFPLALILLIPLLSGLVFSFAPRPGAFQQELAAFRQAQNNGSDSGMVEHLHVVLAWEPWRTDLWELAGQKALEAGDAATAIKDLRTSAGLGLLHAQGWKALGDAYLRTGDWQQAISAWQELIKNGQDSGNDMLKQILVQQWNHQAFAEALQTAKNWLVKEPQSAQAAFKVGLLESVENPLDAPDYLVKSAALDSSLTAQVEVLTNAIHTAYLETHEGYRRVIVGRALGSLGYWDLAVRSFETATISSPDYAEGWAFLGEARQHLGQDGTEALNKAQALDPSSIIVKALTALWNRRNNRIDAAFAQLKEIAALQPDQVIWQIELGNTTALMGDLYLALQYYQNATGAEPSNPQTWMALGEFCAENQMQVSEVGLPAARSALTLTSNSAPALDLMGRMMIALGDKDSAERFLQQAIEKDASFAAAHLHLGQLYLQQNQIEKAYQPLESAFQMAGNDAETGLLAKRLLVRYFGGQ